MEVLQNDIFGKQHKTIPEKEKKQSVATSNKFFKEISLADGINEKELVNDAMLILRTLQRKMIYRGLASKKAKEVFFKILFNELAIKSGRKDPITAVRDSLINFFACK